MNKPKSLKKQFIANSALVVVLVMVISVFLIDARYVRELEKSAQDKLRLHIYTLLSVAQVEDGNLWIPTILYNQRFNKNDSGLWAFVINEEQEEQWRSLSFNVKGLDLGVPSETGSWKFGKQMLSGKTYLTAIYSVAWEDTQRHEFYFYVGEDYSFLEGDVKTFRWLLTVGFILITLSLLVTQYLVLKLAFRPISSLETEISAMDDGNQDQLLQDYPKELKGVTENLNALVAKEYRQRERYRASMADLAHSLKTPIAVLNGELANYPENKTMTDALLRIDNCIEYQLRRAVVSGHTVLQKGTQVNQVLALIVEAMEKIYAERSVELDVQSDSSQYFYGDDNDLMEIMGNLLDNAFKYADRKVAVTVLTKEHGLTITVEDDGVGIDEQDSERIFGRGERLDQKGLGQGIGLAVVHDIVTSYQGKIASGRSRLGGAQFYIEFPKKESIT